MASFSAAPPDPETRTNTRFNPEAELSASADSATSVRRAGTASRPQVFTTAAAPLATAPTFAEESGGGGGGRRPLRTSLVRTSLVRDALLTRRETNTQAHFEATSHPDYEADQHSCVEQVLDFLSVGTGGRLVFSRR